MSEASRGREAKEEDGAGGGQAQGHRVLVGAARASVRKSALGPSVEPGFIGMPSRTRWPCGQAAARTSPAQTRLRCPRCHYDVRTATEGWEQACPVDGRCPECGLEFRWGEVFDPWTSVPRWCVEYASPWRVPVAMLRTFLVAALLPWVFWRRLRMVMPLRPRRLAAYVAAVLVVPPWAVLVVGQGCESNRYWRSAMGAVRQASARPPWLTEHAQGDAPWPGVLDSYVAVGREEGWMPGPGEIHALWVGEIEEFARGVVRADADAVLLDRSRPSHVLKSMALPFSPQGSSAVTGRDGIVGIAPAPGELARERIRSARAMDGSNVKGAESPAFVGALVTRRVEGLLATPGLARHWHELATAATGAIAVIFPPHVCIALCQLAVGALTFVALPQTRRRAKVRWRHIGRVTAYGVWVAAIPAVVPLFIAYARTGGMYVITVTTPDVYSVFGLWTLTEDDLRFLCRATSVYAIPALLWIWWAFASRLYLRIPHAWGVALAQAIIAIGVTLAAYPSTLGWVVDELR